MKEELPESLKSSTKVEESKVDEVVGKQSSEEFEGKSEVKPPAASETGAPSQGNVSSAAAAALASAAVKAKVLLQSPVFCYLSRKVVAFGKC